MKCILILLTATFPMIAQDALYYSSVGVLASGNAADSISSWQRSEVNPVLGSTFDGRSLAIKSAILASSVALQRYAIHKTPQMRRPLTWLNFAVGATLGGVAIRNFRFERR
jgi:hypothetical protein